MITLDLQVQSFFDSLWFVTVTQDVPTGASLRALSKALLILSEGPSGNGARSMSYKI